MPRLKDQLPLVIVSSTYNALFHIGVAAELNRASAARQIVGQQNRIEVRKRAELCGHPDSPQYSSGSPLRIGGIGESRDGQRECAGPFRTEARGVKRRIHDAEIVVFGKERLLVVDAGFDVVNPLYVGELGTNASIVRERESGDGLSLQVAGPRSAKGLLLG